MTKVVVFWLGFGYVQVGFSCWGWGQMFAMVIFRGAGVWGIQMSYIRRAVVWVDREEIRRTYRKIAERWWLGSHRSVGNTPTELRRLRRLSRRQRHTAGDARSQKPPGAVGIPRYRYTASCIFSRSNQIRYDFNSG